MKEPRLYWIMTYFEGSHNSDRPGWLRPDHRRVKKALADLDNDLGGRGGPNDVAGQAERPIISCGGAESLPSSPTQAEVDAYIRFLEIEIKGKKIGILPWEKRGAPEGAMQQLLPRVLFSVMIILALGCSAWLLEVIYEALN